MRTGGSGSGSGLLHSSAFTVPKSGTFQPLQKFKSSPLNVNGDGSVHVPLPLSNTYKKSPLTFNGAKNTVRLAIQFTKAANRAAEAFLYQPREKPLLDFLLLPRVLGIGL